ncbi:MAG: peptidoglycan DD-metalloendopeptidase family protein [Rickettsiales bacterium]|nr:peptidoglycan DD-metalloendopeptidase family protein [Rickettsiales bacterium]
MYEEIFPLFGDEIKGDLHYNFINKEYTSLESATREIFDEIEADGKEIGYAGYLENRSKSLIQTYIYKESRVIHLGIDLFVPTDTNLYAPLDGEVVISEIEKQDGGYGGFVVMKHNINNVVFYTLYGHLKRDYLPKLNSYLKKGDKFASIGNIEENGRWAPHLHLQVFTEKGFGDEWLRKGYCTVEQVGDMYDICPNPFFLVKVRRK